MSKSMFRVYERDEDGKKKKWKLLACFLWRMDAVKYVEGKLDGNTHMGTYKIMRENRNVQVF